jgi:gluconolactonase
MPSSQAHWSLLLALAAACGRASPAPAPSQSDDAAAPVPAADAAAHEAAAVEAAMTVVPDASAGADDEGPLPADAGTDAAAGPFPLASVLATKPELVAKIGGHIEGPSWRDGDLFFAAVGHGLLRMDAAGKLYRYLPDLAPLGTFKLADGRLLVCDDKHTLVLVTRAGTVEVLASGGVCNDITVDAAGNIYFSDFIGTVYRITPEGVQTKAVTGLRAPNGVDVDPASQYLYILPRPSDIYRVAIDASGPKGAPEKLGSTGGRVNDGCVFDEGGNLWGVNYYEGTIAIFDPIKKQVLGTLGAGGGGLTNLTFGGPNNDTLFTTIDNHGVYRLAVGVRGFAGHPGAPQYTSKGTLPIKVLDQPL